MPQFYIVNESTEDTFEASGDLQDAIRLAREVAGQGPPGDPVSVLEAGGKAIRQFVLMPDGTVVEQTVAGQVKLPTLPSELNRGEQVAAANQPRE
jgi:hypothetical protein